MRYRTSSTDERRVASSAPRGISNGTRAARRVRLAATSASCAKSSARPTSPVIRVSPAITFADSIRQTASIVRWVSDVVTACARGEELLQADSREVQLAEALHRLAGTEIVQLVQLA